MRRNCIPRIKVEKYTKPSIYLDTCAMIELSRHERRACTDTHKQEIGELYDTLAAMMREKRLLCPLGNQLQEMGMTKEREPAKLFLYRFTNSELLHPDLIQNAELEAGYRAFVNADSVVELNRYTAFKKHLGSPFVIHAAPVYTPEKARDLHKEKENIADVLNEMKATKNVEASFDEQLCAELESEILLFLSALKNPTASEKACARCLDEISKFYRITGSSPNADPESHINDLAQYTEFLLSPYHDLLPYIWIRANLWSHLMQRPNKIQPSDNLDIQWAAAYLPFVDYAVTDDACRRLLQDSGLTELYGTKVYSLKTLKDLLENLRHV